MPYIDRDKLIKEISMMYKSPTSTEDFMTVGYDHAIADMVVTVHEQPIADVVEQKHGRWVDYPITDGCLQCSLCGVLRIGEVSNFCPNCGAKMDKVSKDE